VVDPGDGSVTASGTGVDAQASVAGGNRSNTDPNASQSHDGVAGTGPLEDLTVRSPCASLVVLD
jgi:hypothetical protein